MDCDVITRVEVWRMARGSTTICWELSQNFWPPEPDSEYHFYVDLGRPGTDEWIALNSEPIIDDCCYIDPCARDQTDGMDVMYRVRMLIPRSDGSCDVYKSEAVGTFGSLSKSDWLKARDIVRREHLQQQKIEGTQGFLLKRKKFGIRCDHCTDWDTKEITDSDCPYCYGTGLEGGYYAGLDYWMTLESNWKRRINAATPPRGTNADINKGARCVFYPPIDTKDIWVRADNDKRYIIDGYTAIAEMRGVPLVVMAQIRLAPASDVVYNVPLEGTPESSSSSSSGEGASCDVRQGLNSGYEDW
jgi:hypothetical protein